ncbi:hypothetical protein [Chitinophaga sp. Cy-1792]|uniref:hypothetical protein n=1 Tax=Chitinophaga sp. Cy-1792 TaxID=2608339 RepID=UPI00142139DA|nr:hypothetical protein [Chitinophaga sp. Cy-1792]NIG56547.1 hypothetical protein [Chitinophaga sp. Cy-1792]
MDLKYSVIWNGHAVGSLSNYTQDMWYIWADWKGLDTLESKEFETLLSNFDHNLFAADPVANCIKVILQGIYSPEKKTYCLALKLEDGGISLREVVAKEAMAMFFPEI